MSRAVVAIHLEIEAEPEPLISAVDHLEEALRYHFAPYVIVNRCAITTKNTFSRPDASESGPEMASPTEGHGSAKFRAALEAIYDVPDADATKMRDIAAEALGRERPSVPRRED